MLAGYILYRFKAPPPAITPFINCVLWAMSMCIMFLLVFGVWNGTLNVIWTAIYVSLGHTGEEIFKVYFFSHFSQIYRKLNFCILIKSYSKTICSIDDIIPIHHIFEYGTYAFLTFFRVQVCNHEYLSFSRKQFQYFIAEWLITFFSSFDSIISMGTGTGLDHIIVRLGTSETDWQIFIVTHTVAVQSSHILCIFNTSRHTNCHVTSIERNHSHCAWFSVDNICWASSYILRSCVGIITAIRSTICTDFKNFI